MIPPSFFDINVHHSECLHVVVRHTSLYCQHKLTWLVFWPRGILSCSAAFTKSRIQEQGEMNTQNEPDRMIMVVYGGSRRDSFRYRGHERLPLQCRPLIPTEQPLVVASISS